MPSIAATTAFWFYESGKTILEDHTRDLPGDHTRDHKENHAGNPGRDQTGPPTKKRPNHAKKAWQRFDEKEYFASAP